MSLLEKIGDEIKTAMRAKDTARLSTLRLIKTDLNRAADEANRDLSADDEIRVLNRMAKQRRDSIDQFTQGNRPELAEKEKAELAVIESFLPAALSDSEIDAVIDGVIADAGDIDPAKKGQLIGKVMAAVKATGKSFDGKSVNERARQRLG